MEEDDDTTNIDKEEKTSKPTDLNLIVKEDEKWLKEVVFQKSVRKELKNWIKGFKYFPFACVGNKTNHKNHVLFFGPPGSGKSYIAEKIGKNEALSYEFVDLRNKLYAGTGQMAIDNILKKKRKNWKIMKILKKPEEKVY